MSNSKGKTKAAIISEVILITLMVAIAAGVTRVSYLQGMDLGPVIAMLAVGGFILVMLYVITIALVKKMRHLPQVLDSAMRAGIRAGLKTKSGFRKKVEQERDRMDRDQ